MRKENAFEHGCVGINLMRGDGGDGRRCHHKAGAGPRVESSFCGQTRDVDRDGSSRGPGARVVGSCLGIESANVAPTSGIADPDYRDRDPDSRFGSTSANDRLVARAKANGGNHVRRSGLRVRDRFDLSDALTRGGI